MFHLRPPDLDGFTISQVRQLADRADTLIRAANRATEQNGQPDG